MLKGKASQSLPSESSGTLSPKEIDRNPGVKRPSLVNFE